MSSTIKNTYYDMYVSELKRFGIDFKSMPFATVINGKLRVDFCFNNIDNYLTGLNKLRKYLHRDNIYTYVYNNTNYISAVFPAEIETTSSNKLNEIVKTWKVKLRMKVLRMLAVLLAQM